MALSWERLAWWFFNCSKNNVSPAYRQILSRARSCARELGVYAPVKVLLVENNTELADTFAHHLRGSDRAAFEVTCTSMECAAALIREQTHDVYVLDATMSKLGGLEVVRALHAEGVNFPFLVVTWENSLHREAMTEDCMGYFQKPVDGDALALALLDAVKNYSTRCITGCIREPIAA